MSEAHCSTSPQELAQYFDHTQLAAYATQQDFEKLCGESAKYGFKMVAINPAPVALCRRLLAGSGVRVGAAVGFPLGQSTLAVKLAETLDAIENGADEIDYVINIGRLKDGDTRYIEQEMETIVDACRKQKRTSKVIFETCYLTDDEKRELCRIALAVRPDFVKTSTGFGPAGATLEDVRLMQGMVGGQIGIKAAGGVRTLETALAMIDAGATRIGSTASVAIMEEYLRQTDGDADAVLNLHENSG